MRILGTTLALLLACQGCNRSSEVVVLHAASLRRALGDAAAEYQRLHPNVRIRLAPSGSQVAIRKVTEQGLRADVVAVADARLLEAMMTPAQASWALEFATNEVVLAHQQHSRFTEEITAQNWTEVLARPGVRLGRVEPDSAPLGYQTLFVWQLAERAGSAGLAQRLAGLVPKEHLAADETELLGLLESKAVDYAFLYRSTAEDHHLKSVALPAELNLSRPELAAQYAQASFELKANGGRVLMRGHPIALGVTIPAAAANASEAERFLAFLVGPRGREIQRAAGLSPMERPVAHGAGPLPASLTAPQ